MPSSWRWRQITELPPPGKPDPAGEAAYQGLLAGKAPQATHETLHSVFATIV